jgi:hypothetical protein
MKETTELTVKLVDASITGVTRCVEVVRVLPRDEHTITFKTRWSPEQHSPDVAKLSISAVGVSMLRRALDTLDKYEQIPTAQQAVEIPAPSNVLWVTNAQGELGLCIHGHVYSYKDGQTHMGEINPTSLWRTFKDGETPGIKTN